MDSKESAIIDSLRIHKQLRFNELFEEAKNKVRPNKETYSRQTFDTRLKKLQKEQWVIKKKNKYELNFLKKDKMNLEKIFSTISKLERKVEKLARTNDPTGEGQEILKEVFNEMYSPTEWYRMCYGEFLSRKEKHQLDICIKKYKNAMKVMVDKLYEVNHLETQFLLQSPDLLFTKK